MAGFASLSPLFSSRVCSISLLKTANICVVSLLRVVRWSRNDEMMQEWVWDGKWVGSEKSVHPTPSAEGVGWTDFTLRMTGMIHGWWDDAEMTWMSLGWAHPIVMPSFQCHPIILVAFHHSKHSKQGGLTLASLRFQKVSPPNPLCRGGWVDWLHA